MRRRGLPAALALLAAAILAASLAAGCDLLTMALPANAPVIPIVQRLPSTGRTFTYTADLGSTARSVSFVFSNPSLPSNPPLNLAVSSASASPILVDGREIAAAPSPLSLAASYPNPKNLREFISEYNRSSWQPGAMRRSVAPTVSSGPVPASGDIPGTQKAFVTDVNPRPASAPTESSRRRSATTASTIRSR